jgi:uncharacterized protein YndB with AHSA1/START domain
MIDVTQQINAVRREVGRRVLEAGEARTVTISQTYDAPIDDLWDACTNPARIPRWFLPISGELRLNGRYQLEGNAGGMIQGCDPPNGFAATWEYGGETSWIELRLTAQSDRQTRLELEHIALVDDQKWAQFGPGAVGVGWDMALMGLADHLSFGGAVDRQDAAAWMASDDGKQFTSNSSDRWRAANVAAGATPADAHGAAERTTAAYSGH